MNSKTAKLINKAAKHRARKIGYGHDRILSNMKAVWYATPRKERHQLRKDLKASLSQ